MTSAGAVANPSEARAALAGICLKATIAATVFAAFALSLRLSGMALLLTLSGCIVVVVLLEAARRRTLRPLPNAFRPVAALLLCAVFGFGVAALGSHGGLLFLPCLFVLGAISVPAHRGFLLVCSVLVAAGFVGPEMVAGETEWSAPSAAIGLVVLPLGFQRIFRGLGTGRPGETRTAALAAEIGPGSLTPRQAEVVRGLAAGKRQREIAEDLRISVVQVRRLTRQARERTGARTTAELVATTFAPSPPRDGAFSSPTP